MKIRLLLLSVLISIGTLYVACGQPPEKAHRKTGNASEKKVSEPRKTIRVKHLAGEVLAVNAKTKTITVRFRDEDVDLNYDDSTVVKIDMDSVKPSEIPLGSRATVKYVERKGRHVAKGIFISTETAEQMEGTPRSSFPNSASDDSRRMSGSLHAQA